MTANKYGHIPEYKQSTHSSFFEMNLANLPNLAQMFTFYTKDINLSSTCSKFRFKTFQNEINLKFLFMIYIFFKEFKF